MSDLDQKIINGLCRFDEEITKEFFYGYCRRAYSIFDRKYQLSSKEGLDFYSISHEYYIQLFTHNFEQLKRKPDNVTLFSWMMGGFRFVLLDALTSYSQKRGKLPTVAIEDYLLNIRSTDEDEGLLRQVAEEVIAHYHDRKMHEIAHMILFEGYKQKEVAEQLDMTPSAINQRYKKMMDEVITPFVNEHYSNGTFLGTSIAGNEPDRQESYRTSVPFRKEPPILFETKEIHTAMGKTRITPQDITSLRDNEIFVFGSNLRGIHGGGAARAARIYFGAVMGQGVGLQGQSYAIPTMQGGPETIQPYVDEFISFARQHPDMRFLVTPIGCGIAGFEPKDIAPLFTEATEVENICLPQSFWDCLSISAK